MENLINLVAASFARNGMANGVAHDGSASSHRGNEASQHSPSLTTALPEHILEHNLRRAPQDDPAP